MGLCAAASWGQGYAIVPMAMSVNMSLEFLWKLAHNTNSRRAVELGEQLLMGKRKLAIHRFWFVKFEPRFYSGASGRWLARQNC